MPMRRAALGDVKEGPEVPWSAAVLRVGVRCQCLEDVGQMMPARQRRGDRSDPAPIAALQSALRDARSATRERRRDCLSRSCRASLGLLMAVAEGQRQAVALAVFRLKIGRAVKSQWKAKARVSMKRPLRSATSSKAAVSMRIVLSFQWVEALR